MDATDSKLKLILFIPRLCAKGGAERAIINLAEYFVTKKFLVKLVSLEGDDLELAYPISSEVTHVKLNIFKHNDFIIKKHIKYLYRFVLIRYLLKAEKPDIVISFTTAMNITVLIAKAGLGIPVIISERNDPHVSKLGWFRSWLRLCIYPFADKVVVQTQRVQRFFSEPVLSKSTIIPNAVSVKPCYNWGKTITNKKKDGYIIIAVGRLHPQKGFDILLHAFSLIADKFLTWQIHIYGVGRDREKLLSLIQQLNLTDRVVLKACVSDIEQVLYQADLMAFPSRYEGFPNALAEGIATGLPVVGFKGVSGVEELIQHEKNGLLVDKIGDVGGLSQALTCLMSDEKLRAKYSNYGVWYIKSWCPEKIYPKWEELINDCC